jgi:outer membrane protein OmpA-like peptidoglycan-associated protein
MVMDGRAAQPRETENPVQARLRKEAATPPSSPGGKGKERGKARGRIGATPALLSALLLSGCSSFSYNPVTWWHNLEGGKIAEQRPPPPGANAPYPNLATVPPRPKPPDKEELQRISQSLVADRAHAEYMAANEPLPDPSSPSASPALFGAGTAPPPSPQLKPAPAPAAQGGTQAASATMPAVTAPPRPAPPAPQSAPQSVSVSRAPVSPVGSTPLASPPPGSAESPAELAAAAPLPAAPPPPPNLPGARAATPVPAPPAAQQSLDAAFAFQDRSATLEPAAADTVKQLAMRRGNAVVAITGYGDATTNAPAAQTAALSLGLSRAQAVANALAAAGVPRDMIRVNAEAIGRGATARLIH